MFARQFLLYTLVLICLLGRGFTDEVAAQTDPATVRAPYFGIRLVDSVTGRGVPLIELKTVNGISHFSDSAGWIAFHEPGLMEQDVYFSLSGPGYTLPADGFGFRGVRLKPQAGQVAVVRMERQNVAERCVRLTGQGIFRDTELLGLPVPGSVAALTTQVVGQDSVQVVPYQGGLFWLWGDTNLANYPLGNFQTTSAVTPLPGPESYRPANGIPYNYLTDPTQPGRVRKMLPIDKPGPVWLFGLLTLADADGKEALISHYTRRKSLAEEAEHGLCRFNDQTGIFEPILTLDLANTWQFPNGNAVLVPADQQPYFYFSGPYPQVRVAANWTSVLNPQQYEALAYDASRKRYDWQRQSPPITQAQEAHLLKQGAITPEQALFQLRDVATSLPVELHHSSVQWNAHRQKWVLIGVQKSLAKESASHLGEVYYAEAAAVYGPWRKAVKIASHPQYSFYNPRQHPYFAEQNDRVIYFEGTYTHTFSGNTHPTPRYEYNQLLYRLDLDDERLAAARE